MANFTYAAEASGYAAWQNVFDPSSITRKALPGGFILWFGQLKDGNVFWLHERAGMFVSFTASDYVTDYVTATLALPSAPLLAMYQAGKFSPGKWVAYLTGEADQVFGSAGNDHLAGGGGDDLMLADDGNDVVNGNAGNDILDGGLGHDNLRGAAGDDRLIGGAGHNTLTGDEGADTFVFDLLEASSFKDKIKDFTPGTDHLELSTAAFSALAAYGLGPLDSGELAYGVAATTADEHLIYNQATGALYYDVDGVGGVAQVQLATLANFAGLQAGDILLV